MSTATGPPNKLNKTSSGTIADTHTAITETLTQSVAPSSHLAKMEADQEAKLANVRSDYEYQIKSIKQEYENRIIEIQEKSNLNIRQKELEAEEKRESLIAQHNEEVHELRDLLTRQVNQDRTVNESLQKEVDVLQAALEEAKHQADLLSSKYSKVSEDNEVLKEFLYTIRQDQMAIQEIATKQQEYLEAARTIRAELLQTLLKQEDKDDENDRMRGTQLVDIADKVQRKIVDFVESKLDRHEINRSNHQHHLRSNTSTHLRRHSPIRGRDLPPRHHVERRGPSRIEVERGEEGDRIYSDQQGQTEVQAYTQQRHHETHHHTSDNGRRLREPHTQEEKVSNAGYGEVHVLGDEISAITENSGY